MRSGTTTGQRHGGRARMLSLQRPCTPTEAILVVICPNCGTENRPGAKFCSECATPLAAGCPNCGTVNPPAAKFCSECATPLQRRATGRGAPPAPPQRRRRRGRGRARRRAPRSSASCSRTSSGFTPFAEERDAEEVRETLTPLLRPRVARSSSRYGGTVEKFIGDAVMAVWGAPIAHEDDAERAVRAALELVDAVPTPRARRSRRAPACSPARRR